MTDGLFGYFGINMCVQTSLPMSYITANASRVWRCDARGRKRGRSWCWVHHETSVLGLAGKARSVTVHHLLPSGI